MTFTRPSRIIGTFTAAAIALTSLTAAPAYAGSDRDQRNARAVASILGLAVVGKILHDHNTRDREKVSGPLYKVQPNGRGHGYTQPQHRAKPLPKRVSRKLLPQQCLRSFSTRRGQVRMFGRRCLENNFQYVNRLPQNCAQRIRTDRGPRSGFDVRCLRRNGYRLARG